MILEKLKRLYSDKIYKYKEVKSRLTLMADGDTVRL